MMRLIASFGVAGLAVAGGLTPNTASAYPTAEIPDGRTSSRRPV